MKFLYTFLLFILCIGYSFAQKQANQWYFGFDAGLNFNSGVPVPILTGQLGTNEGCASIADKTTGNLLFYTDGTYAWDTTNTIMPSSFFMGGNGSTTQAAVIVPKPGSSTIYYEFTQDAQADFWGTGDAGLNCNIIDMSLNGGLGDVTTQDSMMLTPTTEKFGTTLHCNGTDIWVVVHQWNSNAFYAYLITANGIQAPVISYTGIVHEDVGSGDNGESIGYMRISTDGKKLALACYEELNTVQIFDFDNSTGIVSNPITDTNYPNSSGEDGPYGVCFSPDNSKLYVGYYVEFPNPSEIFQYNMLAGSSSAIIASRTVIGSDDNYGYGGIQQAPDGKLYVARESADSISAITNPNALGTACNYVANYVYLGGVGFSSFGVPDIIPNYISGGGTGGSASVSPQSPVVCSGDSVLLVATGGTSYAWSPAEGLSATTGDTVVANPTASVTYTVTITGSGGCSSGGVVTDVVTISPAPNKPIITPSVTGDTLFSSARNGNQWFENDTLKKGATDSILVITGQPKGIYKVVVTNIANGCNTTSDPYSSGINLLGINSGQLSIYPNPTNGSINIKISTAAIGVKNWSLQLVDVLGRTLYTRQSLNYNNKIDISNLPDGMYFITISNAANRAVFPVVKQN